MSTPPPPDPQPTPRSASTFRSDHLEVGSTISDSFAIFFGNFPALAVLALIINLPSFALQIFGSQELAQSDPGAIGLWFSDSILTLLLNFVLTGAVIKGVYEQMCNRPLGLGDCLRVAVGRALPLIIASILTTIAVALGLMLFVIPGIIVSLMLYVVTAVVVVEREGPFEAMARSAELTKGYRWAILWVSLVLSILNMIIGGAAGMILGIFLLESGPMLSNLLTDILTAIVSVLPAVATGVIYYRLREIKEDVDLEDLATVFA